MWQHLSPNLLQTVWRPVEEQAGDADVLLWMEREVEKAHVEGFWVDRDPEDEDT